MSSKMILRALCTSLALAALILAPASASAHGDETVNADGLAFDSWQSYVQSEYFKVAGGRCATPDREVREIFNPNLYDLPEALGGSPADCSAGSTNPTSDYDPTVAFVVPVVVHVLMDDACNQGAMTDQLVQSGIDILNEDFLALTGTNGGQGNDAQVQFALATVDPDGDPTTGITRDCNTTWFNDGGSYWNTLAWDPNRYMNVYTNRASGALGYVPFLPADGGGAQVGSPQDRVVVLWNSFGRNAPIGPPYNQGRTLTHEVGHYLGLEHTFSGGCGTATPPGCYTSGDMICDTNSEANPTFSPCAVGDKSTCGSVDPSDNYMDYSDDLCMLQFTPEQGRRMRCTMEFYRPNVYSVASGDIFDDGFESGDASSWSSISP